MSAGGHASTKVIVYAFLANLGIAIAKFAGAFISGSASMLAEAIHSLVDTSNQVLLFVGQKKSQKPPTAKHPLGFGKEAFFWSFVVSILLFSLGGLFAIYEGVHKLSAHEGMASPVLGFSILVVSLLLESFSFAACIKEIKKQNTFPGLWTWVVKTTSSELLVVFVEDLAAMLGLTFATISLALAWVTQNPVWDAVGSIVIGVLLVIMALFLSIEIKSLIIGEAPSALAEYQDSIAKLANQYIPGGRILKLVALQIGANEVLISCKLSPGQITDVATLIREINAMEKEIKQQFPQVKWLFIEPDYES